MSLRARLLRRSSSGQEEGPPAAFDFGPWKVDPTELRASRDGEAVALTRRELTLLALFASESGRIVSRRRLLRDVWGYPDPERVETRTVDMHIAKLRRKLDASGDSLISTIRGEGYRFSG